MSKGQTQSTFDSIEIGKKYIADRPPGTRITHDFGHDVETFHEETKQGDVLWIDGTEYVIAYKRPRLIQPTTLALVSEDGNEHIEVVAGGLDKQDSDRIYLADIDHLSQLGNNDNGNTRKPSVHDTICSADDVYRLEDDTLEYLHKWIPDTDTRYGCAHCENDTDGDPLHIEQQSHKLIEIRGCTGTDCRHIKRYVTPIPDGEPATVVTYSGSDGFGLETIDGLYEAEEEDDFMVPIETHSGRHDGFRTAREIADFLNPKMAPPTILNAIENEDHSFDILRLLDDAPEPDSDSKIAEPIEDTISALLNTLTDLESDRVIGTIPEAINGETIAEHLNGEQTLHSFYVPLKETLSHDSFATFLTNHIKDPFGRVRNKHTRHTNDHIVQWDDEDSYNPQMTETFTEMETLDGHEIRDGVSQITGYMLQQKGVDVGKYAP